MFGLVSIDSVEIKYEGKEKDKYYEYSFPGGDHATSVVEGVGMGLFALYHVVIIIVLINMLIAMMSHSFEDIQVSKHNSILSFRRLYCHIHAPRAFPNCMWIYPAKQHLSASSPYD